MDKLIKFTWMVMLAVLLLSIVAMIFVAFTGGTPELIGVMTGKVMAVLVWFILILYILKFVFFRKNKT
jgi:hypothetical protein